MTFETWLLFLVVSIAPVVSPGPGVLFALTNSLRYGVRTTIMIGLVNAAGIAVLGLAVGLGLGAVMRASGTAFVILKVVGAIYLIWLGIKIWRDRSAFLVDAGRHAGPPPMGRLTTQALAISLTNPKAVVAIAALFPPFLDASQPATQQVVILTVTYGVLCELNHVVIAFGGGWLRSFLTSPRRARWLRRITGGAFVGFGSLLAVSSRP
ncbi:LysE family translocator [Hoeflea prorocentri]|uniref:LysE family translocator n=1 Tax=Hoeflea prorocentri TaxID=1922333 RepID=A0A9X3UN58_9HYPH|nr:LysE family translocator [Hoeflea prorocentri]MCY6382131.1 LysE family translocator [Hoeflea prorocentri]MDA5399931.1 LysE family translocator [Hoeflea prorocentri]